MNRYNWIIYCMLKKRKAYSDDFVSKHNSNRE